MVARLNRTPDDLLFHTVIVISVRAAGVRLISNFKFWLVLPSLDVEVLILFTSPA